MFNEEIMFKKIDNKFRNYKKRLDLKKHLEKNFRNSISEVIFCVNDLN